MWQMKILGFSAWQLWISLVSKAIACAVTATRLIQICWVILFEIHSRRFRRKTKPIESFYSSKAILKVDLAMFAGWLFSPCSQNVPLPQPFSADTPIFSKKKIAVFCRKKFGPPHLNPSPLVRKMSPWTYFSLPRLWTSLLTDSIGVCFCHNILYKILLYHLLRNRKLCIKRTKVVRNMWQN